MGLRPRISRCIRMTSRILSTAALIRFLACWFCFVGEVCSSGGIGGKGAGMGRSSGDFGCCRAHWAGVDIAIIPINRRNAGIRAIGVENLLFFDNSFLHCLWVCPRGKDIIGSALYFVFSIHLDVDSSIFKRGILFFYVRILLCVKSKYRTIFQSVNFFTG